MARLRNAIQSAEVMRFNPIPWLFSPGVALAGYFYDGLGGAGRALAGWAAVVTVATVWVILRRRFGAGESGS
jgi:hypothetical protein